MENLISVTLFFNTKSIPERESVFSKRMRPDPGPDWALDAADACTGAVCLDGEEIRGAWALHKGAAIRFKNRTSDTMGTWRPGRIVAEAHQMRLDSRNSRQAEWVKYSPASVDPLHPVRTDELDRVTGSLPARVFRLARQLLSGRSQGQSREKVGGHLVSARLQRSIQWP